MSTLPKEKPARTLVVTLRVSSKVLSYFDPTVDAPPTTPATAPADNLPIRRRSTTLSQTLSRSGTPTEAMWRSSLPDFNCESLQQILESLGFVPTAVHEGHRSSNPAVVALSKDISAFARRIYKAPNGEQLALAARIGEFDEELDALLETHGAEIWGRELDNRSHLRKPNASSLYKNHLVWENTGNRK